MADLATTPAQIAPVFPDNAEIFSFIPGVAVERGDSVYEDSAGKLVLSNAGAAGTAKFRGIVLLKAGAGQATNVLKKGHIWGFGVSALAYRAQAFLSNTAGKLADAAGTVSVIVGTVVPLSDSDRTKVLYIDADWKSA